MRRIALCSLSILALSPWASAQTLPSVIQRNAGSNSGFYYTVGDGYAPQDQAAQPSASDVPQQTPQDQVPRVQIGDHPLDQVPNAPAGQDPQSVGPALQVPSNAATMPDDAYLRGLRRPLGEPFRVFGTTPRGIEAGGWWESGYHSDDDGLLNVHDDRPRLHQAWLYAERKAPRCCNVSLGFRVDGMYGVDGQEFQAFGNPPAGAPVDWDNEWDHGSYGFAVPQAYVEVARNDASLIVGKFLNPMGYERPFAPESFFYSVTYGRYHARPWSFSGALTSFDFNQELTIYNGVTAGWDTGLEQTGDGMAYLGGFTFKPCAPVNASYFVSGGDTGYLGDGWDHNLIVDVMLTERLNYVVDATLYDLDASDRFSLANYLLVHVTDRLALGSRFEWYRSDQYTGVDNSTYSWTNGFNLRASANATIRPELRVDWGAGAVDPGNVIFASNFVFTF